MTRHEPLDEDRLIELFGEIEAPAGVDGWRERAGAEPADTDTDPELDPARVLTPLPERWLRPPRAHRRATAVVAAVVALVVGMGGVLVVSQMLTDTPPADPTMNIDGPDGTGAPTSPVPSSQTSQQTQQSTVPPGNATAVQGGRNGRPDGGAGDPPPSGQPVWGPMSGYPTADNTGVPGGSTLTEHKGDLVVDTPGAVVTDLRVSGTVWVNAPDVTLRRVVIDAPGGVNAVEQHGARLRIQDSELSVVMGQAVAVNADGLTLIRNTIPVDDIAVSLRSNSHLIENYVTGSGLHVGPGASDIRLERNTFDQFLMSDFGAPITGVTIRDNSLRHVQAPTESASSGIHVVDNQFHGDDPSAGWKSDGPDWVWSGNTYGDTGEPVSP